MNRSVLIAVLLILAGLRFIVVPVVAWQDEWRSRIESKQARYHKSQQIINDSESYLQLGAQLLQINAAQMNGLFVQSDTIQLDIQQRVDQSLKGFELQRRNFEWVLDLPGDVHQYVAKMTLEGDVQDLMAWQLKLLQAEPWMHLNTINIRRRSNRENDVLRFQGDVTLTAFAHGVGQAGAKAGAEQ